MNVKEIVCRMPEETFVTIKDDKTDEIFVECISCGRMLAFENIDSDIHRILRSFVIGINVGAEHSDLQLTIC